MTVNRSQNEGVICAACMVDLKPIGRIKSIKALERKHEKETGHDIFQEYWKPLQFDGE